MSIHSEWQNAQRTIVHTTFSREWAWDDFEHHGLSILGPMVKAVAQPVANIVDLRHSVWLQPDQIINNIRGGSCPFVEGISLVIFTLADQSVGSLLVTAFSRYHPQRRYLYATSIEEARDVLAHEFSFR